MEPNQLNIENIENVKLLTRQPLHDIKASLLNKLNFNKSDDSSNKQYKIVMQEKDKQLIYLQQQLLLANNQIQELQNDNNIRKQRENDIKKQLYSRDTVNRRNSIALKFTQDKLNSIVSREDKKIKRSSLAKQELEAELDKLEGEYEELVIKSEREKQESKLQYDSLVQQHDEELQKVTTEKDVRMDKLTKDYSKNLIQMSDEITIIQSMIKDLQQEKLDNQNKMISLEYENKELRLQLNGKQVVIESMETTINDDIDNTNKLNQELRKKQTIIGDLRKQFYDLNETFESHITSSELTINELNQRINEFHVNEQQYNVKDNYEQSILSLTLQLKESQDYTSIESN